MNREIKFRGKSPKGAWFFGNLGQSSTGHSKISKRIGGSLFSDIVIDKTLGQFIGMKDISGTEIFEGDIVDCVHNDDSPMPCTRNGVVEYDDKLLSFVIMLGYKGIDGKTNYVALIHQQKDIKVVGNIYDHPHLLKTTP